jgi:hypothetical protein
MYSFRKMSLAPGEEWLAEDHEKCKDSSWERVAQVKGCVGLSFHLWIFSIKHSIYHLLFGMGMNWSIRPILTERIYGAEDTESKERRCHVTFMEHSFL